MADRKTSKRREIFVLRKLALIALLACAVVLMGALPAFAEGYNDGNWNYASGADETTYGANAGLYVRNPLGSGQIYSASGPHGGYTTTTNKCADCHSTHYATGTYMLLRSDSRADACNFCHVGGGGSQTNIQMDNDYNATSVEPTTGAGYGTGHTLGYTGMAPADIKPAFSKSGGFACFDCHTPHGNSERVLTTFANPGRSMGTTAMVDNIYLTDGTFVEAGPLNISTWSTTTVPPAGTAYFGVKLDAGNVIQKKTPTATGPTSLANKPVWPTGRFLLVKNPDVETSGTVEVSDMTTGTAAGTDAQIGYNKLAIGWDDPLGPADGAYGGDQDADNDGNFFGGTDGGLSVNEFCTDCHDGTGGQSTQQAVVHKPGATDTGYGAGYLMASSHDAQPRH